ncbi:MAG: helix-turn-helix domain-containing protein [Faecousia sp.]
MNTYITGSTVKRLREAKGMTQSALADRIGVSSKAVSKWETAKGLPDITLIEPLAQALGVSVLELMSGQQVCNRNRACNLLRTKFYVCPVCGNVLWSAGDAVVSCCGITLPPLEAEPADDDHQITLTPVEDEQFLTVRHSMTREHYISFAAYVTTDRVLLTKLYPEGAAETRFPRAGTGYLYIYCNRHGLIRRNV